MRDGRTAGPVNVEGQVVGKRRDRWMDVTRERRDQRREEDEKEEEPTRLVASE